MCGIIGVIGGNAAKKINFGLSFLQHRGQDATGIATLLGNKLLIDKGFGTADAVFNNERLDALVGDAGIGHVRYATSGRASVLSEIQPFYVNQPFGMALAHNGNLVNQTELRNWLQNKTQRHINSHSDSDLLINIFAHFLSEISNGKPFEVNMLFDAVEKVLEQCKGSMSVVILIAGYGLLSFRDPNGIRPLLIGHNEKKEWLIASESVSFRALSINSYRDVAPGEAIFIDLKGNKHQRLCSKKTTNRPCIFEYIYIARPDSTLDGISVYKSRINMGKKLAQTIKRDYAYLQIDSIIPIPDSGRVAALEVAQQLLLPFREGLVKNRISQRTFITSGQELRKLSVRKKLSVIESEFANKNIMLVDDSIVRGTTAQQLVILAREAGAKNVYFASASPPVRFPNFYGINIPTRNELIASDKSIKEIALYLNADEVIYLSLEDLTAAVGEENEAIEHFEVSCFDGKYPVGNITEEYLQQLEQNITLEHSDDAAVSQRILPLPLHKQ